MRTMRCWSVLSVFAILLAACGDCDSNGGSPQPAGPDLTVAQLNFLHGMVGAGCQQTDNCRLEERADLLFQWIERAGCPDVVTLQEVWRTSAPLIRARLDGACPFAYQAVQGTRLLGLDDEMVLTRYPVLASEQKALFGSFRHVLWVRLDHPLGPIDVFTTHLASGSDSGPQPCTAENSCPPECIAAGAANRRDCQAVQMAAFITAKHDVDAPAVIAGDFNSEPGSFIYHTFTDPGWIDVYLAAGNPECDPATGVGCTSGRQDESLAELESPASNEVERIDFIFLVPPGDGFPCHVQLDPASDRDGDGTATRLFADEPNPFARTCGPAPEEICWPSDHEGVELDLNCG
jgi:endonuclease/exonuclease/phosphatase family metal-dependent hydrolase